MEYAQQMYIKSKIVSDCRFTKYLKLFFKIWSADECSATGC